MAIFQDDNVKIHKAQIVKEWLWGAWRIILTHELVTCPDLKFIASLWDVLEETLQSAGLSQINVMMLFPSRGSSIFGQYLLLTMQESSTL